MSVVFLDSSFVIALHLTRDQNHSRAVSFWNSIDRSTDMVLTSHVLDEIVTFLNSRNRHALAVTLGTEILHAPEIDLVHVSDHLLLQGWDYFTRHGDKRYSLTDCISFVLMKQRGITQALTFDRHFQQAGFECLPVKDSPQS